ncbi:hypothetical protein ABMA28_001082 [Loxostege sticticalis]|uniref:Uncharacterized protein n=1 Tax=Loxostege sticticalis TaxID=481309 RepID=A0ABD0T4J3_LOXSC
MESLHLAMAEMQSSFTTQMAEFQRGLEQATACNTVATLGAQFLSFKKFVLTSLTNLQRQADLLQQECDRLEMQGRRKILLVHGVPEKQGEELASVLVKLFSEHLSLSLPVDALRRCHRMGRASKTKSRPILVKLADVADRDKLWFSKTALKGTGVTISEFLTKARHDTFLEARKRVGVNRCWTRNGTIVVATADGSHRRITNMAELDGIVAGATTAAPHSDPAAGPSGPSGTVSGAAISKSRRKK